MIERILLYTDGANIYKCCDVGELIQRIACMVHMRSPSFKLKDVSEHTKAILKVFDYIFHEDKLVKDLEEEEEPKLLKAVNYVLKEYPCMLRCLEDGRIDLSNNVCERQIRRIAKYRNNSFFAGSPAADIRFTRLMSYFANIWAHKLDPVEYLCDVFRRIKNTARDG